MPAGQDTPLAYQWQGLNLLDAPHVVPETQSPDTTDAGHSEDKLGLLGPRKGRNRTYVAGANIMGIIPFNVPWGRFRLIATTDGTISPVDVPWPLITTPDPATYCPGEGVDIPASMSGGATLTNSGEGTKSGTPVTFTPINLAPYGLTLIAATLSVNFNGLTGTNSATAAIQLRINGIFTSVRTMRAVRTATPDIAVTDTVFYGRLTGVVDACRLQSTVTGTDGNICDGSVQMYLVKGSAA